MRISLVFWACLVIVQSIERLPFNQLNNTDFLFCFVVKSIEQLLLNQLNNIDWPFLCVFLFNRLNDCCSINWTIPTFSVCFTVQSIEWLLLNQLNNFWNYDADLALQHKCCPWLQLTQMIDHSLGSQNEEREVYAGSPLTKLPIHTSSQTKRRV